MRKLDLWCYSPHRMVDSTESTYIEGKGMLDVSIITVLLIVFVGQASPGPATLSIAATSMGQSRGHGVALAFGILTGSLIWSGSAALGLATLMMHFEWAVALLRYVGGAYLLWLAYRSWLSSKSSNSVVSADLTAEQDNAASYQRSYWKGFAIHITNPKAIMMFASLYSFGLPAGATSQTVWLIFVLVAIQSALVNLGYAFLFSTPSIRKGYLKLKRPLDRLVAVFFGVAGGKMLLSSGVQN